MTRILYWNINNFSINKIYNTSSFAAFVEAQSRLDHILNEVIAPTAPPPHRCRPILRRRRINPLQPGNNGAIDNAFVDYAVGLAVPAHNTGIVNTVVGKPYTAVAPAPAGVDATLTGGNGYNSSLAAPIPQPAGVNPAAGLGFFRSWNNFQRIASTSDHLAVTFDV